MRSLIAFFSRAGENYFGGSLKDLSVGNTEAAAGMIQKLIGADLFKIETVQAYPAGYDETTQVAQKEFRQKARPELAGRVNGMDRYDMIFLGYPNWWGTMPMAVFSFLEAYDFSGKTILPFCTHEGSGMGRSESDIKKLCRAAEVAKGLSLRGGNVQEAEGEISEWLRKSGVTTAALT